MYAIEIFLKREVAHGGLRTGAMPMLFIRRDPHRVAGPDFLNRTARQLHAADAGYNMQRLAERVGVPSRARAGLERHPRRAQTRRGRRLYDGILPNCSGE